MRQDGRPQVGRLLLAGSLKSQRTHGGWETAQDFSICLVLSDKNAVRIKDEEVLFRDQFEDLDQMLAEEGGLGPANLEPREPPPLRNADEAAHHIHGAQKDPAVSGRVVTMTSGRRAAGCNPHSQQLLCPHRILPT